MFISNRILEQNNFPIRLLLEKELQHTKSVIVDMEDAVFWVKPNARFLYANDAACNLVRCSREELLSMTMHDIKPDFSPAVWSKHWRTIKEQGYLYFESLYRTKEKQTFPVEITIIYLEYNSSEYGCIFIHNISQRQQASIVLQKVNEVLECKVQQLIAELRDANQKLYREKILRHQVETALEQEKLLIEHKAHFFSMLSHEFRTPLNVISLSASLLKRHLHRWTEEKKLQYLQRLEMAVQEISQLMDEIFLNARPETEKLKFEPKPLNPIQLCTDILAEMNLNESNASCLMPGDPFEVFSREEPHDLLLPKESPVVSPKGEVSSKKSFYSNNGQKKNFPIFASPESPHNVVTLISQRDCTVCADQKLLQPILRNLLSNAVKYSPSGSTIDLIVSRQDEEVIFQIKDRGIGISVGDQQRLFKPFHRGTNVGNIPGNGLGLALVKKLVDLHGGQISVASEVGIGTTFTIALPVQ
ncbi:MULTISPECIES: sensor histidine kinase [unclassified Nostoc]|uniref:sensor histidine kinase n=1 Tax=unclassified Nostoc TaxID=2593658 RepID=UPI002AD1E670|nr:MULTISPECIES: ATP-binding protein [unclassified Nostoc]MDZ8126141.1 ATP-binding protein [Nostoc sp. CmiVER01]MDZ8221764.1 ATP-binding protein [Nostoc sp. ChiVER01]